MHCPSCGHDNIPGDDLCANCGMDLAGIDVKAWGVAPDDPLLRKKISGLPLKPALALREDATVGDAVAAMAEKREGCVFVTDEDGSLSERGAATVPWEDTQQRQFALGHLAILMRRLLNGALETLWMSARLQ